MIDPDLVVAYDEIYVPMIFMIVRGFEDHICCISFPLYGW